MRAHAHLCACMSVALYMEGGREGIMKRQEEMEGRGKLEGHVSNKLSSLSRASNVPLPLPGPPHWKNSLLVLLEEVWQGLGFRRKWRCVKLL